MEQNPLKYSVNHPKYDRPDDSETPDCGCGLRASLFQCKKDGPNQHLWFWCCANNPKACKFYRWCDPETNEASQAAFRDAYPKKGKRKNEDSPSSRSGPQKRSAPSSSPAVEAFSGKNVWQDAALKLIQQRLDEVEKNNRELLELVKKFTLPPPLV